MAASVTTSGHAAGRLLPLTTYLSNLYRLNGASGIPAAFATEIRL